MNEEKLAHAPAPATTDNNLRPEKSVFRFLFCAPMHFVGECEGDGFHLTFAFPSWSRTTSASKNHRTSSRFVLSLRTVPPPKGEVYFPTYEFVGEETSALMCVWFGKLIVNRGHVQSGGTHCVPVESDAPEGDGRRAPFNGAPRRPGGPALNLATAKPLISRYFQAQGDSRLGLMIRAAEFYRAALENFHHRPELALTLFCSALESVLPLRTYSEEELYDEQLRKLLDKVEASDDGPNIVKALKSRLFQIKRKVAAFVRAHTPDSFFLERETSLPWAIIRDRDDLVSRVRKIYDLRSMVLHTGNRSGLWYLEHDHQGAEIGIGEPVVDDAELTKTLVRSMTLTGLERVTATVLRGLLVDWVNLQQGALAIERVESTEQEADTPVQKPDRPAGLPDWLL